ncbi:MAG: gfo/Idh/MocA family oxidoreductase, partial [Mesorhizobium sp.]
MKPRIAVLGCGYWGSNHIRTLKALGALHAVSD